MDVLLDPLAAYVRYEVEGAGYIPRVGGAVVISPHGLLPIDGLLLGAHLREARGRCLHGMSHPYFFKVPGLRRALRRRGFEVGTRGAARRLLEAGHILHTMPGGVREAFRGSGMGRILIWEGRLGYLRLALKAGVPIIPAATPAIDSLYRVTERTVPLTNVLFPGLGQGIPFAYGRGPLPWPFSLPKRVTLRTRLGPPIDHGVSKEGMEDPEALEAGHRRCQAAVLKLWREKD